MGLGVVSGNEDSGCLCYTMDLCLQFVVLLGLNPCVWSLMQW